MAKYSTLTALFSAIANSLRAKTGTTGKIVADDFPSVIDGISVGVEGGIIPTGTKSITSNGTHDVRTYESAEVNVPIPSGYIKPSGTKSITTNGTHDVTSFASATVNVQTGITPTGTKDITANGEHDVTNFAKAKVSVPTGLNAKVLTATVSADKTSGNATMIANNAFLASLYNNPNAFIFMRYLGVEPSTAMLPFWFSANFPLFYNAGTAVKYDLVARSTASATAFVAGGGLKATDNYNGHLKLDSSGNLKVYCNATYPLKAGEYQIIAGTVEML